MKNLKDIRGPELKDNYLIHKQYGIRVCMMKDIIFVTVCGNSFISYTFS